MPPLHINTSPTNVRPPEGSALEYTKPCFEEPNKYNYWNFNLTGVYLTDPALAPEAQKEQIVANALGVLAVTVHNELSSYDPSTVSPLFTYSDSPSRRSRWDRYMSQTVSAPDGTSRRRREVSTANMASIVDFVMAELEPTNHPIHQLITALQRVYGEKIDDFETTQISADIIKTTRERLFKAAIEAEIEKWHDQSPKTRERRSGTSPGGERLKLVKQTPATSETEETKRAPRRKTRVSRIGKAVTRIRHNHRARNNNIRSPGTSTSVKRQFLGTGIGRHVKQRSN